MRSKSGFDRTFDLINTALLILVSFVMLYPLYFTLIASVSEPYLVAKGFVTVYPRGFTLEAYQNIFINKEIWSGYRNTAFYTFTGTAWNLLLTVPAAYVMSKKNLPGRSFFSWFFLIPMYFGGGLIPTYLLVKDLGLLNKIWTLVILGGLSIYDMIVTRVYFQTSIPEELYESARIDGASDFRMFLQIALPLAKPIVAVMALFYGVGRWNDFFTALVYVTNKSLAPLQLVLRRILILNENMEQRIAQGSLSAQDIADTLRRAYMAESMKYAVIFIASAPLLIAYPFVQKYFVKGVLIGSLKG